MRKGQFSRGGWKEEEEDKTKTKDANQLSSDKTSLLRSNKTRLRKENRKDTQFVSGNIVLL
jgi:hypothetical protein